MKQKIEAGVVSDLGSFIKSISDILFQWMDKLDSMGVDISKPTKNFDGSIALDIATKDMEHEAHVVMIPQAGEDHIYDLEITPKGGTKEVLKGVGGAYISKRIQKWMEKHQWDLDFDDDTDTTEPETDANADSEPVADTETETSDNDENTWASSHIRFALKKITASTGDHVILTAINAGTNRNLVDVSSMLHDIVANDEFCATLTEDPQTFEVTPCEDNTLEVNPCEEPCSTIGTYAALMAVAVNFWGDLKTVHWNAVGEGFFDLHEKMDEYITAIESDIDTFGELAMEYDNFVPNPIAAAGHFAHGIPTGGFTSDIGFGVIRSGMLDYIDAMECAYVNCPHDVQAKLNTYIRYWRKESEYKLRRQQTGPANPLP